MDSEPTEEQPKKKRLGRRTDPPKGLDEVAAAANMLESRFEQRPTAEEPVDQASAATAAEPEPQPEPAAAPKAPRAPRKEADGMTRKTFYLTETDAAEFEATVEQISAALKGRVPKHRIIGALLAPGLADIDGRINLLREELFAELSA